jgi:hypothetical protein
VVTKGINQREVLDVADGYILRNEDDVIAAWYLSDSTAAYVRNRQRPDRVPRSDCVEEIPAIVEEYAVRIAKPVQRRRTEQQRLVFPPPFVLLGIRVVNLGRVCIHAHDEVTGL